MSIFNRPHYTSDATQFIDELKRANPAIEAGQRAGRALLWDKNLDRSQQKEYIDGKVSQQPYVYQTQAK
ncbi:MAG: DUF3460 family protein [Janthinobacterium lividum]